MHSKTGPAPRRRLSCLLAVVLAAATAALAAPAKADADVPSDFFGVYWEMIYPPRSPDRAYDFEAQRAAGVDLVRQPFDWGLIEPSPGRFEFAPYDAYMADAALAGMRLLPILVDAPRWASGLPSEVPDRGPQPPRSERVPDFARFAGAVVARYGPGGEFWRAHPELPHVPIRSWQVWNEPNLRAWWGGALWQGPGPSAELYAELLIPTSRAIKAADPNAEVVAAGLPESPHGIPRDDFLDGLYEAGAGPYFDVAAVHPYDRDARGLIGQVEGFRAQLDRHGDRDKPIWVSEFGWATEGPYHDFTTDEANQAARIATIFDELVRRRRELRIRGLAWYSWRDAHPRDPTPDPPWFVRAGLLHIDGFPKPGFFAYRDAVARARPRPASGPGSGAGRLPDGTAAPRTASQFGVGLLGARTIRVTGAWKVPLTISCGADAVGSCAGMAFVDRGAVDHRETLGRTRVAAQSGGSAVAGAPLSSRARRELRSRGRLRARARVTVLDSRGRLAETTRTIALLRPRLDRFRQQRTGG